MKSRAFMLAAVMVPLAGAVASVITVSRASDRMDGQYPTADIAADITDVYAFMRPEGDPSTTSDHLVLVMNVNPDATATTRFSDKVDYVFRLARVSNPTTLSTAGPITVTCRAFNETTDSGAILSQKMSCLANGFATTVDTETVKGSPTDNIRVFAGVRSDPFFFDAVAFKNSLAGGSLTFNADGGTNTYLNKNVLSIVVELSVPKIVNANIVGDAGAPTLVVGAETKRHY